MHSVIKRNAKLSIFLLGICAVQFLIFAPAWPAQPKKIDSTPASPLKLFGKIDVIISACAAAGITLSSNTLPSTITKIRLGSPAVYGNLYVGDRVTSAEVNDRKLSLVIERNGMKYSAQLDIVPSERLLEETTYSNQSTNKSDQTISSLNLKPTDKLFSDISQPNTKADNGQKFLSPPAKLQNTAAKIAVTPINNPLKSEVTDNDSAKIANPSDWELEPNHPKSSTQRHTSLTGNAENKTIKDVLIDHDLVLIIDHSESMDSPDCPGQLSRWQWCCQQTAELAKAAADAANSITVVVFNDNYRVFNNILSDEIDDIFKQYHPSGGTVLARPLQKTVDEYFRSRLKPLTIVIITDGEPEDRTNMARLIKETSDRLQYCGEITITFLLISNEVKEDQLQAKLGLVPNSSVVEGGLVDIIPFKLVSSKGVEQTLLEELKTIRLATNKSMRSKASQYATGVSIETSKHRHFVLW